MVAKFPKRIHRSVRIVVYYSETKVKNGTAEYVCAVNFHKEIDEMTPEEKIHFFVQRNLLNQACKANTPHIILSFHPSEKFTKGKFAAIASAYMEGIGFGDQPYLVYYHTDTQAPHLHIVTTLIDANGVRIETHNIGQDKSAPTRLEIEERFGLIKAKGRRNKDELRESPGRLKKINYGVVETYRSVSEVVQAVTSQYVFTTIGELNAILKQYNVFAETGKKGSKTAGNRGLYYRVLDEDGKPLGVPIKASDLPGKPTLKFLVSKFEQNRSRKEGRQKSIRTRVEWALSKAPKNLKEFTEDLEAEGIKVVLWQNESGWAYGITFLDLKTKTAINGRDLGRDMGIGALQSRWSAKAFPKGANIENRPFERPQTDPYFAHSSGYYEPDMAFARLIDLLLQPIPQDDQVPYELSAKKKKKEQKPPTF